MVTPPAVRPKISEKLRLRVFQEIINHPEIGAREIIQNLIQEDPGRVVYFYSNSINETLTLEEQVMVYTGKTISERRKLLKKLIRNRADEFVINLAVITRIKSSLNKSHAPSTPHGAIYGASGLGYVVEKALNMDRAARWLYPRLAQIQHECLAWNKTAQVLDRSDSPERKKVSEAVRKWITRSMVYREIKDITDGIRDEFLHKR